MFRWLKRRLGSQKPTNDLFGRMEADIRNSLREIDFDDPAQRIGIQLYIMLREQFDILGKPEGEFPFVSPFASEKARGALLGTAVAVVSLEYGDSPVDLVTDAAIVAFTLTFGNAVGKQAALETISQACQGNKNINLAAKWATEDAVGCIEKGMLTNSCGYHVAVEGLL